jgi:hypothetical protein
MDLTKFSDYLSTDKINHIIALHDSRFKPDVQGLQFWVKFLLILLPLFPIQIFFAGQFLARGEKKKWKEYWFFFPLVICFGQL